MIEMLKKIGIFVVIAQAVLYFVPGEAYAKYVKVIIGIIMIAKLAQPILALVSEEGWDEIMEQSYDFSELSEYGADEDLMKNSENTIFQGIEEELKTRLNESPADGYYVERAAVKTDAAGKSEEIVITVTRKDRENKIEIEAVVIGDSESKMPEAEVGETEELKEYYGNLISVPADKIRVVIK